MNFCGYGLVNLPQFGSKTALMPERHQSRFLNWIKKMARACEPNEKPGLFARQEDSRVPYSL
jgi:hypothetical protein